MIARVFASLFLSACMLSALEQDAKPPAPPQQPLKELPYTPSLDLNSLEPFGLVRALISTNSLVGGG